MKRRLSGYDRGGTNLIELVVVLSLQAVLLATGVGLIGRMLETEQAGRSGLETLHSIDSLSDQFRRDVHAASEVSLPQDEADSITLRLPSDVDVTYDIQNGRLTRSERTADKLAGEEAYRFPATWKARFNRIGHEPGQTIRLTISEESSRQPSKKRSIVCEALLGRDAEEEAKP